MSDSTCFKSIFKRNGSQPESIFNDAILLSSDEECLFKSNDEIFYDTNSFHSWENMLAETDMSNASDKEEYSSCSEQLSAFSEFSNLENTDNTSVNFLPGTKTNLIDLKSMSLHNSNHSQKNLQYQQNLKIKEEMYEMNRSVPLKILLRRMFDKILGSHTKDSNIIHSTKISTNEVSSDCSNLSAIKMNNTIEIDNYDLLRQLLKNKNPRVTSKNKEDFNRDNTVSSYDRSTTSFLNNVHPTRLVTILEDSRENSTISSKYNSFNSFEKSIDELTNFSCQKLRDRRYTNDKIFIPNETGNNTTSSLNTSEDIEVMSNEIFKKIDELKNADSLTDPLNFVIQKKNIFHSNDKIIKLTSFIIPSIIITPATPT